MPIKRVNKKGQEVIGMSFSTILSIMIIIAIVGVAAYVLVYFLDVNKCAQGGFFYEDLQDEINKVWTSERYSGFFEGEIASSGLLRSGVEFVCFGNLTSSSSGQDRTMRDEINYDGRYRRSSNIFLYPPEKICAGLESKKLGHVDIEGFFCLNLEESDGE